MIKRFIKGLSKPQPHEPVQSIAPEQSVQHRSCTHCAWASQYAYCLHLHSVMALQPVNAETSCNRFTQQTERLDPDFVRPQIPVNRTCATCSLWRPRADNRLGQCGAITSRVILTGRGATCDQYEPPAPEENDSQHCNTCVHFSGEFCENPNMDHVIVAFDFVCEQHQRRIPEPPVPDQPMRTCSTCRSWLNSNNMPGGICANSQVFDNTGYTAANDTCSNYQSRPNFGQCNTCIFNRYRSGYLTCVNSASQMYNAQTAHVTGCTQYRQRV